MGVNPPRRQHRLMGEACSAACYLCAALGELLPPSEPRSLRLWDGGKSPLTGLPTAAFVKHLGRLAHRRSSDSDLQTAPTHTATCAGKPTREDAVSNTCLLLATRAAAKRGLRGGHASLLLFLLSGHGSWLSTNHPFSVFSPALGARLTDRRELTFLHPELPTCQAG